MLVNQLLSEIMTATGERHFQVDPVVMMNQVEEWMRRGIYVVYVATKQNSAPLQGFLTLHENFSLYAGGAFGTIPEIYVRPDCRSQGIGQMLLDRAVTHALSREWKRLEVTTPPLPVFDRTFHFYRQHGFSVAGGRKLRRLL